MRPKFVSAVLLLACAFLAAVATLSKVLHPHEPAAVAPVSPHPEDGRGTTRTASAAARTSFVRIPEPALVTVNAHDESEEAIQLQYGHRRIDELKTLARNGDTASGSALLAELQNQDKDTRKTALEAIIQLDDRSMIPYLQEIASQTEDAVEKAEITKAIEYIQLPSLSERLAQQNVGPPTYQR